MIGFCHYNMCTLLSPTTLYSYLKIEYETAVIKKKVRQYMHTTDLKVLCWSADDQSMSA